MLLEKPTVVMNKINTELIPRFDGSLAQTQMSPLKTFCVPIRSFSKLLSGEYTDF